MRLPLQALVSPQSTKDFLGLHECVCNDTLIRRLAQFLNKRPLIRDSYRLKKEVGQRCRKQLVELIKIGVACWGWERETEDSRNDINETNINSNSLPRSVTNGIGPRPHLVRLKWTSSAGRALRRVGVFFALVPGWEMPRSETSLVTGLMVTPLQDILLGIKR